MNPLGAAGSNPVNPYSSLKGSMTTRKWSASASAGSPAATSDLKLSRANVFEQKIEEDGLPTTVVYDAFGRFRKAILPKGQLVDLYV